MILLESGNRLLADLVRSFLIPDADYKPAPTEVKLYDFDNSSFFIRVEESDLSRVIISLSLPCYREIKDKGADAALQGAFGSMLIAPEQGFDVTIALGKSDYEGKEEAIIDLASRLKRITLGGVFEHFLAPLAKGTPAPPSFKFDLRRDTTVYFIPKADRVTVGFRISFMDKADNEIGRVFLREFADPSLRRKLGNAPIVDFDVQPQVALKEFGVDRAAPSDLGFVCFTMLPLHCQDARRAKVVESLQVFRNFVQYHLKCAKSYMHSRMRQATVKWTQYLNRAKRNTETNQPKRILTAGGKLKLS